MSVRYACDECGKLIEESVEPYYEIEVTRHAPKAEAYRWYSEATLLAGQRRVEIDEGIEAWIHHYLHFCAPCWRKIGMSQYYNEGE
jgi:hypothetical protein